MEKYLELERVNRPDLPWEQSTETINYSLSPREVFGRNSVALVEKEDSHVLDKSIDTFVIMEEEDEAAAASPSQRRRLAQ